MIKNELKHKSKEDLIDEIRLLQSEIKKHEDSDKLFAHYYDNVPAFAYIKDSDSNYFFINKKCEELFNVKRNELKNRKYTDFDFFNDEMAKQLRENDKLVMQSGNNIETEEIGKPEGNQNINMKAGHRYYLALKFPLKDSEGNIIGVCGFSHDITKNKEMEHELKDTISKLSDALYEIKALKKKEKEKIYYATIQGTQHILNNLLNQLYLIKYEIKNHPTFSKDVSGKFNSMLIEANNLVGKLSSVKNIEEEEIKESVRPK